MKSFLPLVFLPVGIESIEQHGPLYGIPVMACASVSISKIASRSLPMLQQCRLLPRPSLPHDFICVALTLLRQRPRPPEIPCSFERLWSYTGRTALTTVTSILVRNITFPLRFYFRPLFAPHENRIPTFETDASFWLPLKLPVSKYPGEIKNCPA